MQEVDEWILVSKRWSLPALYHSFKLYTISGDVKHFGKILDSASIGFVTSAKDK